MSYESFEEYQYNSCVSRGICSINPRVSSLQTVIVLYLRMFAKFAGNLDVENDDKHFILNTIATTINNPVPPIVTVVGKLVNCENIIGNPAITDRNAAPRTVNLDKTLLTYFFKKRL